VGGVGKEEKMQNRKITIGEERQGFTQNKIDSSFPLECLNSATSLATHKFICTDLENVSRENGPTESPQAALDRAVQFCDIL
jgi:hypothetical protein